MANEPLITALEGLLDSYRQRYRATSALTAGLKGTNGALNKARRTLGDYLAQTTTLDPALLSQVAQSLESLRFREDVADLLLPDLRREAKLLTAQIHALKDAVGALSGDLVDVIKLDRAYQSLRISPLQDEAVSALMPELAAELEQAQARLGDEFGAALRDKLAAMGLQLGGRPPRFEIGRYEIVADFVSRSAALSYGKMTLAARVKLSLDTLIAVYQNEVKAIEGRNEDGQRWMEMLHAAWYNARRKSERNSARMNIVDCYYELVLLRQGRTFNSFPSKRSFTDYSRAQFAYDLDLFARQQRLAYQGLHVTLHTATKTQAESQSRSMWLVTGSSPHDGTYISDIEFAKTLL